MPNCIQLIRKGSTEPISFQDIDAELCAHFNVPCDPVNWYEGWYDIIAFSLACGASFDDIERRFQSYIDEGRDYHRLMEINTYLSRNFTPNTWVEIGRR